MKYTLIVDAMRHGQKDGEGNNADLTDRGQRQVEAAIRTHVKRGDSYDLYLHSGVIRTRRALKVARATLGHNIVEDPRSQECEAFGFLWLQQEVSTLPPFAEAEKKIETELGNRVTVRDWLERWWPAVAMRGRLLEYLDGLAYRFNAIPKHSRCNEYEYRVLAASHGPLVVLGAPLYFHADINYGDMVRYTYTIENGIARKEVEILRCPHIE